LWQHYTTPKLSQNMRLKTTNSNVSATTIIQFVNWILQIGDVLGKNVIYAIVITRKNVGDKIFKSTMNFTPFNFSIPFKFQRREFPTCLWFVIKINKR